MHDHLQEFHRVVEYEVELRKEGLLSQEEIDQLNLLSPAERKQFRSERRQARVNSGVGLREYGPSQTSPPLEWRQEWVGVFLKLCEPLYNFLSLPEMNELC